MDTQPKQDENKQIKNLFEGGKEQILVQEINKHINNTSKLPEGTVSKISKSTYQMWINEKQKETIMLVQIQLYSDCYKDLKQKPQQFQLLIKKFNQLLEKIGKNKIDETVMKNIIEKSHQDNIFIEYRKLKQQLKVQEKKSTNLENNQIQKKQKEDTEKDKLKIEQQKIDNERKLQQQKKYEPIQDKIQGQNKLKLAFEKFMTDQKIEQQDMMQIKQKFGVQCSIPLLKQFKNCQVDNKAADKTQHAFNSQEYAKWYQSKYVQKQGDNPAKRKIDQVNKQIKQKSKFPQQKKEKEDIKKQKKRSEGKLVNLLAKYFKKPKTEKNKNVSNISFEVKYQSESNLQNQIQFCITNQIDKEQIIKYKQQCIKKNIILTGQGIVYLILQFDTKKGEVIQEKLEELKKQEKIVQEQAQYVTLSQKQKLFVSISFKNNKYLNHSNKIYQIFTNQCKGKIEVQGKFSMDKQGKLKPENKKIAKCLAKGFTFKIETSGNEQFNWRFRKNIELQTQNSLSYSLFSLSKKSQIALKFKKIDDVNNLFGKFGVLDAANSSLSVKQIIEGLLLQIFEEDIQQVVDINWLLSQIISIGQISKIGITKFSENVLLSASIRQGAIINQLFQK